MDKYVERVRNIIRVVSAVSDEKFDIRYWWNPMLQCGCAIGYAVHDEYFIKNGLDDSLGPDTINNVAKFFDISPNRAIELFICRSRYGARLEVLSALRVLLMEKEAALVAASHMETVEFLAADIKEEIAGDIEDMQCR
jgi:hypothetical protein